MQIVVLDGFSINPGDVSWQSLHALGKCTIHERTKPEETLARVKNATAIMTSKVAIDGRMMESLPQLRYIGIMATGYNIVDISATRARNITVTNIPAYGTQAVAQGTFALLLELTNRVGHHNQTVHDGKWSNGGDWCYWDQPIIELAGLTMGIVGFGHIGQAVASIAHSFGMNVLVCTRTPGRHKLPEYAKLCSLEELLAESDVISLHCPLTEETRGLINAKTLATMKPSAFLLNAGRGPLIDEAALAEALTSGRIAGAGLDVMAVEPPAPNNPLLHIGNCVITPHNSWATVAARKRLIHILAKNLSAFMDGHPTNVVNN
jgi:glycerate dehydrogenase